MFSLLPCDVINHILAYNGTIIRERNGKFMKQIPKNDKRYDLLHKLVRNSIVNHGTEDCNLFLYINRKLSIKINYKNMDMRYIRYVYYFSGKHYRTYYVYIPK